ncbi:MAG: hypothetical protein HFJ55_02760 [Clostridia bacterium]|nr:hypothetical protein [Clostridia bacterium]
MGNNIEKDIIEKLKKDIAIYQFREENNKKQNKSSNKIIKTIKKIIIGILSTIVAGGTIIYAYTQSNIMDIENIDITLQLSESMKNAVDNGYIENINTAYEYKNGIGCKINSLIISDKDMNIVVDFDFTDKEIVQNQIFAKFIIYDENKNVYCNYSPLTKKSSDLKYQKKFYRSMKLSHKNELNMSKSYTNLYLKDNRFIAQLMLDSITPIPRAQKIYINIYDVGYIDYNKDEYVYLFKDTDWNFSINVPELFYNRANIEFETQGKLNKVKVENFYVTDTGTIMTGTIKDDFMPLNIQIVDENGKTYKYYSCTRIGEDKEYGKFQYEFDFNKNMLTNKMVLQIRK